MRKRIFSVILALCMVLGLLPATAWAEGSAPATPPTYNIFNIKVPFNKVFDCQKRRGGATAVVYKFDYVYAKDETTYFRYTRIDEIREFADAIANPGNYHYEFSQGANGIILTLYKNDGSFSRVLFDNGEIEAYGADSFVYVANNHYGCFVSLNSRDYHNYVSSSCESAFGSITCDDPNISDYYEKYVKHGCGEAFTVLPAPTAATYTVSFHNGGGKGTMDAVTGVSGTYTLPANGFTPPNGKQFKAWSVGSEEKAVGETINVTANTTVTAVWEDIPAGPFQIIPSKTSMRGKGTVTLKVVNIPDAATVDVTCDEFSIDLTDNHDNTWSAYLPNRTQTYTFTATATTVDEFVVSVNSCTVDVQKKYSDSSDSSSSGNDKPAEKPEEKPADKPAEKPEEKPVDKPEVKPEEVPKQEKIVLTIGEKVAIAFGDPVVNDVAPVIRSDRAMLPIRFVAEALGGTVTWNQAEQSVTCVKGDNTIVIYIGQPFALVNGNPVELDAPAFIENGRTYLPIRFVAENLDATVTWNADTQEVTVVPNK